MGILQARILEWVAVPSSRGSSQPRDQTQVFHIAGRYFTDWATREAREVLGEMKTKGKLCPDKEMWLRSWRTRKQTKLSLVPPREFLLK